MLSFCDIVDITIFAFEYFYIFRVFVLFHQRILFYFMKISTSNHINTSNHMLKVTNNQQFEIKSFESHKNFANNLWCNINKTLLFLKSLKSTLLVQYKTTT